MTEPFESHGIREIRFQQGGETIDPTIDIPDNSGMYGFSEKKYMRPELLAPSEVDAGGFLFLPGTVRPEMLSQLVALSGLGSNEWRRQLQYGIQVIDAPQGMEQELGYLRKVVISGKYALRFLFNAITQEEYEQFSDQPLDVEEMVIAFIEDERGKYGTGFGSPKLAGKFGGDGYLAQEALSFGFAIENKYHGVISVWSRAWLVTK